MIFRVFDFETTGFPEEGKPSAVIQVGWTDLEYDADAGIVVRVGEPFQTLVNPFRGNPELKIDIGAKATHHIIEEDLADAPSIEPVFSKLVAGADAFACHNREHDGHYFTGAGKPIVCTLKAAKVVWPDAESHSNQFLRYLLRLPVDRNLASPAHEAGPDSYVTAHLLAAILSSGAGLSDLIEWTHTPELLRTIRFGKHKGERFEDIPTGYLEWLYREKSDDKNLMATVRHHLDLRGALS